MHAADIAKNVFQVHGMDVAEKVVLRKQLRRSQVLEFFKALLPRLIGVEALRHSPLLGACQTAVAAKQKYQ